MVRPRIDRRARYEQEKQAWIARQLQNCPPLTEQQKAIIRTAFASLRADKAAAA